MAKFVGTSQNPSNPELFGEDVGALAWQAVGVGLTAYLNDRITRPLVQRFVPHVPSADSVTGKLVDAGTTGVTGWAAGEAASMVDRPIGRRIRQGGILLAVAKAISAFIPGFSLSGSLPLPGNFQLFPPPAAPQLTNGSSGTAKSVNGMTAVSTSRNTMGI